MVELCLIQKATQDRQDPFLKKSHPLSSMGHCGELETLGLTTKHDSSEIRIRNPHSFLIPDESQ